MFSSPAIGSDGTIYVGTYYSPYGIYAINPSDGSIKWNYPISEQVWSSPAIGSDGTIYVGIFSGDPELYAIKPDGTLKWKTDFIAELIYNSPAIGSDGTIYVGTYHTEYETSGNFQIYAVNPNGTLKWKTNFIGFRMFSSPAIGSDGTIYVGTRSATQGELYAIYSSPGWTYATYESSMRAYANSNWPKFGQNNYNLRRVVSAPPRGDPEISKSLPIAKIMKILGLYPKE